MRGTRRRLLASMGLVLIAPTLARRLSVYVDKILRGTKPGDLPSEAPTKFELTVNARTAKALGIAIPSAMLLRADRVIE